MFQKKKIDYEYLKIFFNVNIYFNKGLNTYKWLISSEKNILFFIVIYKDILYKVININEA